MKYIYHGNTLSFCHYLGKAGWKSLLKKQNLRVMKLIALLLTVTSLQLSPKTYAQHITLQVSNAPMAQVFEQVYMQTGYQFVATKSMLKQAHPVSISIKNASLQEVLSLCFKDQPFTYKVKNKAIIVKSKVPTAIPDYLHLSLLPIQITGTVTDSATGNPLPGVTIKVTGKASGTITDKSGHFSLNVPDDAVLIVSFLGYKSKTIPVKGTHTFNISLAPMTTGLNQLVVIGYGSVQSKYLTGSVSSVGGKKLQNIPASGVNQILGGRAAGVHVTNVGGAPGAPSVIRIRGGNSIQGNNNPLYVVDGVIMGQDYNLNNLNVSDIESINILKDATAVAIYGTRGANGVVLITTKTGTNQLAGKAKVSVDIYAGKQIFVNNIHFLNGLQLAKYANEDAKNRQAAIPFPDLSKVPNTNWIDLLTHNAPVYNADVSVSGLSSDGKLNYYISGGYFNQQGIVINSGFKKYNLTANFDLNLSDYVSVGLRSHITRMHTNHDKVDFGGGEGSLVHGIIPVRSVYDSSGNFTAKNPVSGTVQTNPMADALLRTNYTNSTHLLTSLYLKVTPIKGLVLKTSFSPVLDYTKHNVYNPGTLPQNLIINAGGNGQVSMGTTLNLLNTNTATYSTHIGLNQKINLLGGFTWQTVRSEGVNAHGYAYFNDDETFNNLGAGSDPTRNAIGSNYNSFQLVSWLGRANYSFKDKYLLTLVGRLDGSSRFAEGNKYSFFPAAAVAWRLDQESFIQQMRFFDILKLKVSYGLSGSQAIPSFRTLPVLSAVSTTFGGVAQPGVALGRPANPALNWETTNELDIGLSAAIFNGRLSFDVDYYNKKTKDLLLNVQIPRQTGFDSKLQNLGSLRNQGIDFSITSTNISSKNFHWNTTLNVSGNRNKVLNLGGVPYINIITPTNQGGPGGRLIVGKTAPVFVGVQYLGTWKSQHDIDASGMLNQHLGGPHYKDTNGDGQISVEDFEILGDPQPIFHGGIQNTLTYKNFTLDIFFQGTYGNDLFNTLTQTAFFGRAAENKYAIVANRWTPDNPNSDIPRAGSVVSFSGIFNNSKEIVDGSYLRLKSLQLSYGLPVKRWGEFWKNFQNLSVFFSGENLFLLSDFKLFDPEASKYGNTGNQYSNVLPGYIDGAYPYPKTVTLGIKATL